MKLSDQRGCRVSKPKRKYTLGNKVVGSYTDPDGSKWVEVDISTGRWPNTYMKIDLEFWESINEAYSSRVFAFDYSGRQNGDPCIHLNGYNVKVSRLIAGKPGNSVYHIDKDGLNCRLKNFRIVTR